MDLSPFPEPMKSGRRMTLTTEKPTGASLCQRWFDTLQVMPSFETKVTEIRENPKDRYGNLSGSS